MIAATAERGGRILKTVKGTLRGRRYIIIPLEASDAAGARESLRRRRIRRFFIVLFVVLVTVENKRKVERKREREREMERERERVSVSRGAREDRFTIHKTTRRIELSSLARCGSCQSRPPPGGANLHNPVRVDDSNWRIVSISVAANICIRAAALPLPLSSSLALSRRRHPIALLNSGPPRSRNPSFRVLVSFLRAPRSLLSAFTSSSLSPSRARAVERDRTAILCLSPFPSSSSSFSLFLLLSFFARLLSGFIMFSSLITCVVKVRFVYNFSHTPFAFFLSVLSVYSTRIRRDAPPVAAR